MTDPDGLVTSYTYDGLNNLTNLASPDTGGTSYTYDAAGNRSSQTDARGITATYRYDALNRLIGIGYPTVALNVSFAYDQPATGCYNLGRLTRMSDSSGATTYCYDRRGNVLKKTQSTLETRSCSSTETGCGSGYQTAVLGTATPNPTLTAAATFTVAYAYNLADRVIAITYPTGVVVSYGRDSVGRVSSVTYQASAGAPKTTILGSIGYYPFGPANTLSFGNGRSLSKSYDSDYAIHSVASSAPDGTVIGAQVDSLGNLTGASATIGGPLTQQYQYDALYRLTTVKDASGKPQLTLTYGPTGDRLSKTLAGQSTQAYSYVPGTHQLAAVAGAPRSGDANGNTLSGGLSYDDRNRLAGWNLSGGQINLVANSVVYGYNGRGERVSKQTMQYATCTTACNTIPGTPIGWLTGTEAFVYDESGRLLGEYPGQYAGGIAGDYVYLDGTPIALVRSGVVYYIETDPLGTPREVIKPGSTTATDTLVWKWDYFANTSAFGENTPSVQTLKFNLRFPGQYYDVETGLNYNYFRDYEPGTGRYIESDPMGLAGGIGTYTYVEANPLDGIDPLGLLKIYGYWCGPDWTGGFKKPWNDLTPWEKEHVHPPKSPLDALCMKHDICYGECALKSPCDMKERQLCLLTKCDRPLIDGAKKRGFWGNLVAAGIAIGKPGKHPKDADPPPDPKTCSCGGDK